MISGKDLESYLAGFQNEEYQGKYYKTFKELSQRIPEDSESNMVESEEMAFGTDELKQYFIKTGNLRSADALYFFTRKQKHHIYLFEFKSGFLRKINLATFDDKYWVCEEYDTQRRCKTRANDNKELIEKIIVELKNSIYVKLTESFVILKELIFPRCNDADIQYHVHYIAVVDGINESPLDVLEDGLDELAKVGTKSDKNSIKKMKSCMKKYLVTNENGEHIMYDEADVWTKEKFDASFSRQ